MAGHRHEGCARPFLAFRWKHRYWVCDCGKEYRWTKHYGHLRWVLRSEEWAPRHHSHDQNQIYELAHRVNLVIDNLPEKAKHRVQEGA